MRFSRLLRHSAASGQIENTLGKTLSGDRVNVCPVIQPDGDDLGRRVVEMPSNSTAPPVSTGLMRAPSEGIASRVVTRELATLYRRGRSAY